MRKILLKIVMLLIFVVILSACSNNESGSIYHDGEFEDTFIAFDYLVLEDAEGLAEEATHIIRAEVLDQRVEWLDLTISREMVEQLLEEEGLTTAEIEAELDGIIFECEKLDLVTISNVKVLEIFQGDHNVGDEIEIMKLGGEYGSERWIVEDALEMEVGSEFVLFLVSWKVAELPYSLISHAQGAYYIPDELIIDEVDILDENNDIEPELELESAGDVDPVTITIEDLIDIAESSECEQTVCDQ